MKLTQYDKPMRRDKEWRRIAMQNGIQPATYYNRIYAGWGRREAATTPLQRHVKRGADKLAAEMGVSYDAAYKRILRHSDE